MTPSDTEARMRNSAAAVMDWARPHLKHDVAFSTLCEAIENAMFPAYDAAMLRARNEAIEGQWQPIETAPKDGTDILVGGGKFRPMVASWCADRWVNVWTFSSETAPNPTHWMPLPGPPK